MQLRLEEHVHTADGVSGTLADVVIDPAKRTVTHVVVRAGEPDPTARLVPLQLVTGGDKPGDAVSLTCTAEEFARLESVQGYAYLPVDERPAPDSQWDVGVEDVVMMPSYQGADLGVYTAEIDPNVGVTYDRVPKGEVEIRHSSVVASSDGHEVGTVYAIVADGGAITDVVVEKGHLWWKRVVSVPAASVATLETNAIGLGVTKGEFSKLPRARKQS
jgi:sporulation protein YlmC with PRC-barrel domain